MTFVLVKILISGTSHSIMVDGTIEFRMRYILVTSLDNVVYSQTVELGFTGHAMDSRVISTFVL